MTKPFKIAVLISGGGTTLRNLIEFDRRDSLDAEIAIVISSSINAGGLNFAKQANIRTLVVDHRKCSGLEDFSSQIFDACRAANVDLIVMGGFLKRVKIPGDFENRVINIHPSLIPSFCGQGNYGSRVHQAIIDYGCKISGCTVHFVDDQYDHGPIIAQETVVVKPEDTPETLAARVFERECQLYPTVINSIAHGRVQIDGRQVNMRPEN